MKSGVLFGLQEGGAQAPTSLATQAAASTSLPAGTVTEPLTQLMNFTTGAASEAALLGVRAAKPSERGGNTDKCHFSQWKMAK